MVHAQTTSTVSGRVTSATTGQPVANADVQIVGTSSHARTDADGRYAIVHAPVGVFRIEARSVTAGAADVHNESLRRDAATIVNFSLSMNPVRRNEPVTSATPFAIAERSAPFTVNTLTTADMPVTGLASALDVLQGKVAGAAVARVTGTPGTQPSVQLRTPISLTDSLGPCTRWMA